MIPMPMWIEASLAVETAQRLLLVTHVSPDGDAIGSLLGLGNALRTRGKQLDLVVDGGVPAYLDFLPGAEAVRTSLDEGEWDVMISLDSSDEPRTGASGAYGRAHSKTVIDVDHHPSNTLFGSIHLVVPDAVSTTEIVYDWLVRLGIPLTADIASPLLAGLLTDTLGFRTSNVRAGTLGLAQRLMEAGAPYADIVQRTLNSKNYRSIELWKRALATVTLEDGIISAQVTRADWEAVGYTEETDDGLVGYLIATEEPKIAVVFKEAHKGGIDISLRSKPGCDVASVAVALGGGGHRQASGAHVEGTMEEVRARVMPLLRSALDG